MAAGIALAALATGAGAQALQVSSQAEEPAKAPELRVEDGKLLLTVDEAIAMALRRNLGIAVQRFDREEARQGIFQATGVYDLFGSASAGYSDSKQATQSGFESGRFKTSTFNLGLSQLIATGGTMSLGWQSSRSDSGRPPQLPPGVQYNSVFVKTAPTLTFKQPLLRDLGRLATEHTILVARVSNDISRAAFEQQVLSTVQSVENAYWNLIQSRDQLQVAQDALALAKELHQTNKVRVEVGTLAPLELVQSEVGIAEAEETIVTAQGAVGNAEDALRRLINPESATVWTQPVVPETPAVMDREKIDLDQAIKTALDMRQDLAQARLTVKSKELDATYFHNQRKPRLDATVSYGLSNGTEQVSTVFDQITRFPTWSVGLALAIPIQNRTARAQSTIADLELDKAKAGLQDFELQVITDVRTAVRTVETAGKQIESAKISRTLAEKNLDAERKRYENGMSTSFQVLQIQNDLIAAKGREVTAITGYRKALVDYERATGTLLQQLHVEITEPGQQP
ncbi:MAG: TolC family protein [Acidobacteriota bacterium]